MKKSKRILIAPLNWGLGHATRCIPVINHLLDEGHELLLASDGRALELLKKEFPQLRFFNLPGYNIRYTTRNMLFNIAYQLPKIGSAFIKERKFVKKLVEQEKIDIVISDNRFGCFTEKSNNIFITHQLNIIVPFRPLEWIVNQINHHLVQQFDECWVPDFKGAQSLAGQLSKQKKLQNVQYIGPLSRMKKMELEKEYDLIAVLSGPEPQRSYFEKQLIDELKLLPLKSLLVQGKTDTEHYHFIDENIEVRSYLTAQELNRKMAASEVVIARSGYSTVMDLVAMGKKAILVPTPGQTEQEYLARRLYKLGCFYYQTQDKLEISSAIHELKKLKGLSRFSEKSGLITPLFET